jgi:hypothetical protein
MSDQVLAHVGGTLDYEEISIGCHVIARNEVTKQSIRSNPFFVTRRDGLLRPSLVELRRTSSSARNDGAVGWVERSDTHPTNLEHDFAFSRRDAPEVFHFVVPPP